MDDFPTDLVFILCCHDRTFNRHIVDFKFYFTVKILVNFEKPYFNSFYIHMPSDHLMPSTANRTRYEPAEAPLSGLPPSEPQYPSRCGGGFILEGNQTDLGSPADGPEKGRNR